MNDINVKDLVPHRNSMLILYDILSIESTYAEGIYTVRGNEFFLDGHYPQKKIVPGAILCEMMAQLTAAFVGYTRKIDGTPILAEIKNARFKKLVLPGEKLLIKMNVIKDSFRVLKAECSVNVEDIMVAKAELTIAIK